MNILIVDDSPALAMALARGLSMAGHFVKTAIDGRDGLTMFDLFHFDAVISDYQMPVMNGLHMLQEMRCRDAGVKLVMMSGANEPKGLPANTSFLAKPFDREDLMALLEAE